jgi:hypothetical protein
MVGVSSRDDCCCRANMAVGLLSTDVGVGGVGGPLEGGGGASGDFLLFAGGVGDGGLLFVVGRPGGVVMFGGIGVVGPRGAFIAGTTGAFATVGFVDMAIWDGGGSGDDGCCCCRCSFRFALNFFGPWAVCAAVRNDDMAAGEYAAPTLPVLAGLA